MINDRILPYEVLEPVYLDRAFYFGDGVYEVIRSYNGRIFALDEHLERCSNSLSAIGINGVDIKDIYRRVTQAFDEASIPNAKIYFHITRGSAPRNHSYSDDLKPNFFLTVTELQSNEQVKKSGIAVSAYPDLRWKRCDIKSLNLLANVLARQDAVSKGCDEAILVDERGFITEGAGSAFFAIFEDKLQTAPLSNKILPSITRKYVIKAAGNINMIVTEESLMPEKAKSADELFIAVTTKDVVPVIRFDENVIKDGKPGHYTKKLMEEFKRLTN